LNAKFRAIPVQHPQHEEVPAREGVLAEPKWSKDRRSRRRRRVDDVAAGKALGSAQPVAGYLMAERARHTVGRESIAVGVGAPDRQVGEHLSVAATRLRERTRHRHVARRAFILDRRLM
jgi:hypothetical protein